MDLSTRYLGLKLQHPLVASASPLSRELYGVRQLADAGASAVVMYSLFEEQIAWAGRPISKSPNLRCAPSYIPNWAAEPIGPDEYLDLIRLAKRAIDIPVIGSLNGTAPGGWTWYARLIEDAGADALELNLYFIPTDANLSSVDVEQRYLDTVQEVKQSVTCPVAVKISPYFTALPSMANRLAAAGADGLVLFNRYYEPDFDIEARSVNAQRVSLSGSDDLRLPLRWIALLSGNVPADLALTGGVHNHVDVLKSLMAGANFTMLASELMQNGIGRMGEILSDLSRWLEAHGYSSLSEVQGILSAQRHTGEPGSSERAGYIRTIHAPQPEAAQPFA